MTRTAAASLKTVRGGAAMLRWAQSIRCQGLTLGFVPTMGALHEGHLSLIRRARRENDRVAVSIFVNPIQFGPNEDYRRYPRPLGLDRRMCREAGVDVLYHPAAREMYPAGFSTHVEVEGLSDLHCGEFRPGHFRGVATVVLKLFERVRPHRAYFGEKDYQQLVVIRRMVRDLELPVTIVPCPTMREADGLARSSRNAYLSPAERARAPALHRALALGARLGRARAPLRTLRRRLEREVREITGARIDYVRIVDAETLEEVRDRSASRRLRILAAVRLGRTRLIDNVPLVVRR